MTAKLVWFNREWVRPGSFGGTFANAWYGAESVKRSGISVWKTREEAMWYRFASREVVASGRNEVMESKWLIAPGL